MPDDPVAPELKAVLWDFGGVILSSPFEAFARYEQDKGLPKDFIRTLNATNPDTNAWARFERNEVPFDEFCDLFEAEARALGHELAAREVMPLLAGQIRPEMVSVGKLNNVREAIAIARECRTVLGAAGITLEHPVMRHANNLESVLTYEGTVEMHTLVLGEALTGHAAFR